ncbi:MAG: endonuclease/exonuclease/phosphatase family protein [Gemmatimonadales bacterium]
MLKPIVCCAAVLAVLALPAATGAAPKRHADVTVMTRNLFLGANLLPLAVSKPGAEFEHAAGDVLRHVTASEPNERMTLIAREIARAKPDLVGLQEVTLWRTGPKGDPAPATDVRVDYLAALRAALVAAGAHYRVVADHRTLNLEAPTDAAVDVRLTEGNVVLARKGVRVRHVRSSDFGHELVIPTQALGDVSVHRSFNQLDATVRGAKLHFVNTHLEAYSAATRLDQAKELVRRALRSRRQTILVGDLNSGRKLPKREDRPPYEAITRAGLKEERTSKMQCCLEDDLVSGRWDHIVDHIMARPKVKLVRSFVTGTEKTPGGRRPSDHGGVVSVLRVKR